MSEVEILGRLGPEGPALFVLYTGGTFGMAPGPDGSLVPLDLRELGAHLPVIRQLPVALTTQDAKGTSGRAAACLPCGGGAIRGCHRPLLQ